MAVSAVKYLSCSSTFAQKEQAGPMKETGLLFLNSLEEHNTRGQGREANGPGPAVIQASQGLPGHSTAKIIEVLQTRLACLRIDSFDHIGDTFLNA